MYLMQPTSCIVLVMALSVPLTSAARLNLDNKECVGSETLTLSKSGSAMDQYYMYRSMYENCTSVSNNLVLTYLPASVDLSFLSGITQVYGAVLISQNDIPVIPLHRLTVIRGANLHTQNLLSNNQPENFSLVVSANEGLKELQMPALQEILKGNVLFKNNKQLCFEKTINWTYILNRRSAKSFFEYDVELLGPQCRANSGKSQHMLCDESCRWGDKRYCWGSGSQMCQTLTSQNCSQRCTAQGLRCYGLHDSECCHEQCAGGCTGYLNSECLACRNFELEGRCVQYCPPREKPNENGLMEINPDFRYLYNGQCVKSCGMMKHYDIYCVSQCKAGFYEETSNNTCLPCNGGCRNDTAICVIADNAPVSTKTIEKFRNCTHVVGAILILNKTFTGEDSNGGLTIEELEVLSQVEEITGYLYVDSYIPDLKSLSFLRNLKTIRGQSAYMESNLPFSLLVHFSSLEYLGLVSLKEIKAGNAAVTNNQHLCYTPGLEFRDFFSNKDQKRKVKDNADNAFCEKTGQTCSEECEGGCWGPGPEKCVRCKGYVFEGRCLSECAIPGSNLTLYNTTEQNNVKACRRCHPECALGCSGERAVDCYGCRNVEARSPKGRECQAVCPANTYPDADNVCQRCDGSCSGGCSGPSRNPGVGGCNGCYQLAISTGNGSYECLAESVQKCPSEYFFRQESFNISTTDGAPIEKSTKVCYRCHPECRTCYEADNNHCERDCVHFEEEQRCVFNCSHGYFINELANTTCKRCSLEDEQREECIGVAHLSSVGHLPPGPLSAVIGVPIFIIVAVFIVSATVLSVREKRRKLRQKLMDEIPLTSTEAAPDLSSLRLIEESELKLGNSIGSGAFGTVYKGVWIPSKENLKIPVAVKVLTDRASSNMNVELLEEARVMASVRHQYCIRILAVCMSAPMQLVTPLMPHGCLLDYIRKNKSNIGSKSLLTWSVQIARGMEYLENRGIVHRDLAARNVLVQNANRVKITDFGLAKLLEYKAEEYQSTEGKMPIKWLALESLQHRIYTHKSDVWSYGVTLWEIFTYGQKPYEDINARAIPNALERGVRLQQPDICTIDVYLIMIKCWMLDASSRPCFSELAMEFTKMAMDPGRYLVIPNDRFMRLQSTASDNVDLVRELSGIEDLLEGPGQVISGEDYLRPNDLDFPDGCKSAPPQSFNHLLSIQEEDGYLNSNFGTAAREPMLSPPLKLGMVQSETPSGEYSRYSEDPCRADQPPRTQAPTINKAVPKPQPKTDDCGYLDPQAPAQTGYLEVKDLLPPDVNSTASKPFTGPQEQYFNVIGCPGLNNPSYYNNNLHSNDYLNTNR